MHRSSSSPTSSPNPSPNSSPNPALIPLIAVLVATAAWSFSADARAKPQEAGNESSTAQASMAECRADLQPEVVAAGAEVSIGVSFPRDLGEVTAVHTEDGSGIIVQGFDPAGTELSALTAQLEIPVDAAGAWWLEFDAEGSTCKALLTVTEPALDR